jgi:diguanylate cyclase (GGDEF)-like protein
VDGLTGIGNRRTFDDTLAREAGRSVREKCPMALVLIDIDHFKKFNDHYGHQGGDDALRQVAQALAAALKRPGDVVARYGGEEFAIVRPNTDAAGAMHIAEDIRAAIRSLGIEHRASDVADVVTLSLGIATTDPTAGPIDPAAVIARADAALYEAKRGGRDRAHVG